MSVPALKSKIQTLAEMLERKKSALALSMPRHLDPNRFVKVVIGEALKNPQLLSCRQDSVFLSVANAAALGLEPGPLQHVYLVPYGDRCQMIIGYKGLLSLARRSGDIANIYARCVYANEEYDVQFGDEERIVHKPMVSGDRGPLLFVYAVGKLKTGEKFLEVMTKDDIEHVRASSKSGRSGPWKDHYDQMARKTVLRRLCNVLPMSVDLADALSAEEEGTQISSLAVESIGSEDGEVFDSEASSAVSELAAELKK